MKSSRLVRILISCSIIFLIVGLQEGRVVAITVLSPIASVQSLETGGTISGTVFEEDGITPIPSVGIFITTLDTYNQAVCSDISGDFEFTDVPFDIPIWVLSPASWFDCGGEEYYYAAEWWSEAKTQSYGNIITLTETSPDVTGIVFTLAPEGLLPNAVIRTSFFENWVDLWDFSPSNEVSISIYQSPGGSLVIDSVLFDTDENGSVFTDYWGEFGTFDIQSGNVITVLDQGTGVSKSLEVGEFTVDSFDRETGDVFGSAPQSTMVDVLLFPCCGSAKTISEPDGSWYVNIGPFSADQEPAALIYDEDGDMTETTITPAWLLPYISVQPSNDWIIGYGWPEDQGVSLVIATDENFSQESLIYESQDPQPPGSLPPSPAGGNVFFDLTEIVDVAPTNYVKLDNGSFTKIMQVANISMELNHETNIATGLEPDSNLVYVWAGLCDGSSGYSDEFQADGDGIWSVDFGAEGFDILPVMCGYVEAYEPDADKTAFFTMTELEHLVRVIENPSEHLDDYWLSIQLRSWEPDTEVTLHVYSDDSKTTLVSGPHIGTTDVEGSVGFGYQIDRLHLALDNYVVVTNSSFSVEGYIPTLTDIDVDYDGGAGCITGVGVSGKLLTINYQVDDISDLLHYEEFLPTDNWSVCLNDGDSQVGEQSWFNFEIYDGNITHGVFYPGLWGSLDEPFIEVHPSLDWVMVSELPVGTEVTLEVRSDSFSGDQLILPRTQTTEALGLNKLKGTTQFYLWDEIEGESLDLLPSHYITISYEGRVKQIIGQELTYDVLDLENGIISGTGPAGEVVHLEFLYHPVPVYGSVDIQPDGTWLHNFVVTEPLPSDTWGTLEYYNAGSDGGIFVNSPNCFGKNGGVLEDETDQTEIYLPPEALASPEKITTDDLGSNFSLLTDQGVAYAVYGVNIGPDGTEFDIPITIMMSWLDTDDDGIVDSTGQNESYLFIAKDGVAITDTCAVEVIQCDPVSNIFAVEVSSLSNFVLVSDNPSVVSSDRAGPYPTNAASVDFYVTFSETVTGVDTTDFDVFTTGAVSGAAVTGVSGSGDSYTVTVSTGSSEGTVRLDVLNNGTIIDDGSNPLDGGFTGGESYTIDKTPPETSIDVYPDDPSGDDSPTFEFSSPDGTATFECQLDSGGFSACASPHDYIGLSDGEHIFEVRSVDMASNTDLTPASYTWNIDTAPPETSIDVYPDDPSGEDSPTFEFSSPDGSATFECQLDGGGFSACTSPHAYSGLSDGEHTFEVQAVDLLSNTDPTPASYTWTIDTTPPDTSIDSYPADPSAEDSSSFAFSSPDGSATFECQLDGGGFTTCTSPHDYTGLGDGEHTFEVQAVDQAGNQDGSPASFIWTIDTTPPDTSIDAQPDDPSADDSPSFEFSSPDGSATFECQLDSGGFSACTSPHGYSGLGDGEHTFEVQAVDLVGNIDLSPASYTWTIDTTPPDTSIDSQPDDPSVDDSPSFEFSSPDGSASFECQLDSGGFSACTSPHSYSGLGDGEHTFEVQAVDLVGNIDLSPASFTWTIDATPPETSIDFQPNDPNSEASPSFSSAVLTAALPSSASLTAAVSPPALPRIVTQG